jgi:hypothetical protein
VIRAAVSSLALLLLLLGAAQTATARKPAARMKVGVVPLSSNGEGADKVAGSVARAIINSLKGRHHHVQVFDDVRAAKLRLCLQQPSCVRTLASKYSLGLLISGHVEKAGSGYQLDVNAASGKTGDVVGSESLQLQSGQVESVGLRVSQQLLAKARKAPTAPKREGAEPDESPPTKSDAEAAAAIMEKGDGEDPLSKKKKLEASIHGPAEPVYKPPPKPLTFGQRYWPSLTCAGVGVAAVIVGAVFGAKAKGGESDARDTKSQAEAYTFLDGAHQNAKIANIMFGVGGGVLAVGAVLLIIELVGARNERKALEQPSPEPKDEPKGVRAPTFHIGVSAGGAGIFARGEF